MRFNNAIQSASLCAALVLLLCSPLQALESDKQQPINIEADSVELDEDKQQSVYKGNVILTQGSIKITAERIAIKQKNGSADHVSATGTPVTFQQKGETASEDINGEAKKAEYYAKEDTLILQGEAEMVQGQDTFKSDRIVYDRTQSLIKAGTSAEGTGRVRVTIKSSTGSEQ